ncbi:TPA: hypothetical protein ACGBQ6_004502 [Yersinia enterocolitica]|uniref:Uncharacterized protein n=1 Tax=Yersinia intermedia TaxID=631 RepID=A0ABX6F5H5_YERIN|nr:hypothetical protein [Yersinia intermedia]HDL8291726.1 hypothetical protein [Yersinia enterocolitica]QGR65271.1 hypothetical protein FOC38_04510 [Yersinia intermedia]QGR70288.1 hypothetical protein FOC37_07815 [Yersinia intermedia]HEI6714190.1 hypothetical protein [Yersinia enterocolitica]HEK6332961.1 hypothetical protein [Yersinia enterocolitica]
MSEFKGTPGPWLATVRNNNDLMTQFYGVLIGSISVDIPTENQAIDARLIAAAPDLLEALKAVVAIADRDTDVFNAAKAAIAKATGVDAMIKARG